MILSRVVLPEPLSPRMARNSPAATSREMSRRTGCRPKDFTTFRMLSRHEFEACWGEGARASTATTAFDLRTFHADEVYCSLSDWTLSRGRGRPRHTVIAATRTIALLLLRSRFRCTERGAEHFARNKCAFGTRRRYRGAGSSAA